MPTRLPPQAEWRYRRSLRRRGDRWGFVLVAVSVVWLIEVMGEPGLGMQWLVSLPTSLGFTMFSGHSERRYAGHVAPLFRQSANHADPR